eukprot:9259743-Lingulodinium_polyedra.AAC.1
MPTFRNQLHRLRMDAARHAERDLRDVEAAETTMEVELKPRGGTAVGPERGGGSRGPRGGGATWA